MNAGGATEADAAGVGSASAATGPGVRASREDAMGEDAAVGIIAVPLERVGGAEHASATTARGHSPLTVASAAWSS